MSFDKIKHAILNQLEDLKMVLTWCLLFKGM